MHFSLVSRAASVGFGTEPRFARASLPKHRPRWTDLNHDLKRGNVLHTDAFKVKQTLNAQIRNSLTTREKLA